MNARQRVAVNNTHLSSFDLSVRGKKPKCCMNHIPLKRQEEMRFSLKVL